MTDPVVWLDGALRPQSAARVDPLSQGFLQGMGVYDTLLLRRGVVVAKEQHLARLAAGAALLGLRVPSSESLSKALADVSRANGLSDARLRITLTGGAWQGILPPLNAPQVCLITALPLPPVKVCAVAVTSRWRRNENSPLAGIKFTACAENVLAQRAASAAGADEAIFLNTKRHLCEGAFSNVFLVRSGAVFTPPLSSGCLPGVTREIVIGICREHGIPLLEEEIPSTEEADEVFLTSTLRGVQPVGLMDQRPLPAPGPVTGGIMSLYAAWLDAAGGPV
ncbi:MAG TPA: aminotransferase class IV [Verrucomicrobiales bacterium]|jgi:branched-chain amino acid aminotransferase|nr:aminotransferase class IV [Verrucomicrobiales bacterium]